MQLLKGTWTGENTLEFIMPTNMYLTGGHLPTGAGECTRSTNQSEAFLWKENQTVNPRLETVLLLLPMEYNKLTLQWQEPHEVQEVVNQMDDNICVKGKTKIYHANLLKLYHERADNTAITIQPDVPVWQSSTQSRVVMRNVSWRMKTCWN